MVSPEQLSRMYETKPTDIYRKRCETFATERERLDRQVRRLQHGRMVAFLLGSVCLVGAWDANGPLRGTLCVTGLFLLLAFVGLATADARARARHRLQQELLRVNEEAIRRIRREWDQLPEPDYGPPPNHAYATDLDLFGHASLFQLLGTTGTVAGRETLRRWLLHPAGRDVIRERQESVAELAPLLDYRNHLEAHGRLVGREHPRALHAFLDWAKTDTWILNERLLIWSARMLPLFTFPLLLLGIVGTIPFTMWFIPVGLGLVITRRTKGRMKQVFSLVSSGDVGLRRYGPLFKSASTGSFETSLLSHLCSEVAPAFEHMRRLDQILTCAETRHSNLLHMLVQNFLLWDHHVLHALEEWQRDAGPFVAAWVAALGEIEALAALAALSHAHPEWAFAEIVEEDESPRFEAEGLGHPLLRTDGCVENDVTIGPPGTFLFVTGSNMSGKSTLLRSVGINAVLAQAGGPVYARKMRLTRVSLFTSMRVSDSLDLGISQYMAQLNRLKAIVDGARISFEQEDQGQHLFLLDEILQGTNSAERLVAVRRIVCRLLSYSAIGAVTSHELTVPDVPELSTAAVVVHFKETARQTPAGVTLAFDYRLRPGLSTSTNALKLMEMVGLD